MNKLKSVVRSVSFSTRPSSSSKTQRQDREKLEPVVGFQLTLYDAANDNTSGERLKRNPLQLKVTKQFQFHNSMFFWSAHVICHRILDWRPSKATSSRWGGEAYQQMTLNFIYFQVKLFPGSAKFESSIQTSSWPKFGETFRFPMAPLHK